MLFSNPQRHHLQVPIGLDKDCDSWVILLMGTDISWQVKCQLGSLRGYDLQTDLC